MRFVRTHFLRALSIFKGTVPALTRGSWHHGAHLLVGSQDQTCSTAVMARTILTWNLILNQEKSKAEIRSLILAKRDGLSVKNRVESSLLAAELAGEFIQFPPGTVISGFFPIRSEIDPRPLMDVLRKRGAVLCLPVVRNKTTLEFRELVPGAEFVDAGFGTKGPSDTARVVDPQMMLMPLSVYDNQGGRIGYGAGHYDRAISNLHQRKIVPKLIGMAFECQCVDFVPQEPHDVAMDAIVTENGFLEFDKV